MFRGRAVMLSIAISACVPPSLPAAPSKGGPAWLELSSDHFTVWTDGPSADAHRLVQVMEHLRQIIYGVSFFRQTSNVKFLVIALQNAEEVHAYLPVQFIAYAAPGRNALMQPLIVLPLDHLDNDRRIITHELTHAISYGALPVQPHWFAEGLASYFETVRLDEAHHKADVGMPEDFRIRQLRKTSPVPIASLLGCAQATCMDDRFYTTVWALFAFLANAHPDELMHYIQDLAAVTTNTASTAWPSQFTSEPLDRIDHDLANWLAYGRTLVSEYKLDLQDSPITERSLGDADAFAARAVMHNVFAWDGPTPPEVDQALAIDPTNVVANAIKASHEKAITPEKARAIAAAHPEDWRAWWLVSQAVRHGPEAADARTKTCELSAKNPPMLPKGLCPPSPPSPPSP